MLDDVNRVILKKTADEGSDYINASWINVSREGGRGREKEREKERGREREREREGEMEGEREGDRGLERQRGRESAMENVLLTLIDVHVYTVSATCIPV